jgi:hypothetical protein
MGALIAADGIQRTLLGDCILSAANEIRSRPTDDPGRRRCFTTSSVDHWCKHCQHQVEPDPAETVTRYGAETTVPDWRERLIGYGLPHPPVGPRQSAKG